MPTSNDTFPRRLTEIDDLTRPDHHWLDRDDRCLFLGEYTARRGYSFSRTNNVVLNFKKSVERRGRSEWQYKELEIVNVAQAFGHAIAARFLAAVTLIPIPPSRAKGDPLYDDRMVRMLRAIPAQQPLDIRELILQRHSTEAVHDAEERPTPDEIAEGYCIDEQLARPEPATVAIFDDVMTTGAHYVAARHVLSDRFPHAKFFGFFIARRAPEADFSLIFDEPEDQ